MVSAPTDVLSPLETEIIDLFVQLSRILGQPRSLAEIYGLLFISGRPLAMDDLIARLNLSKGSASQGLKYLRNIGAVKSVYMPGDRRVHYEAVAELRNLATRFLRDQILPHLDDGLNRMDRIATLLEENQNGTSNDNNKANDANNATQGSTTMDPAERARVAARILMLQSWGKKTRRVLPLMVKILS